MVSLILTGSVASSLLRIPHELYAHMVKQLSLSLCQIKTASSNARTHPFRMKKCLQSPLLVNSIM